MINTIGIVFHFMLEFYTFILQFIFKLFQIISHYSTSLFLKLHDFALTSSIKIGVIMALFSKQNNFKRCTKHSSYFFKLKALDSMFVMAYMYRFEQFSCGL